MKRGVASEKNYLLWSGRLICVLQLIKKILLRQTQKKDQSFYHKTIKQLTFKRKRFEKQKGLLQSLVFCIFLRGTLIPSCNVLFQESC